LSLSQNDNSVGNFQPTRGSLQGSLHQMLTWFLSPKSLGLEHDGVHAVHMVANHLAEGFAILDEALPTDTTNKVRIPAFDRAHYEADDREYLAPIIELESRVNSGISKHVTDFMIHGSLATLDYSKGWSDFDTFVIVARDTVLNGRALTVLRTQLLDSYNLLTAIDPLQHHGFIVCSEIDLRRFSESIMPMVVLQKAKSLLGERTHNLNLLNGAENERQNLSARASFFRDAGEQGVMKHHAYNGVYLRSHYKNADNALFQFKYLLSTAALAPCYYAGAIGRPAYKSDAIEQIQPLLSDSSKKFLESTTLVRIQWPLREEFPYQGNAIPDWVREYVDADYIVNLGKFLTELDKLAGESS